MLYSFTNLGFFKILDLFNEYVKPNMSSVTNICPLHSTEAPIPIVGIEILDVIFFAASLATASITIANAPAFYISSASSTREFSSSFVKPLIEILLKLLTV